MLIGCISVLYIYPLNDEAFGFIQFLYSSALLLVPFIGLGINNSLIKFFSLVPKGLEQRSSFLLFAIIVTLGLSVFIGLLGFLVKDIVFDIISKYGFDALLFRQQLPYIFAISIIINLIGLFTAYLSNYGKIAFPALINGFGFKLLSPFIVVLIVSNTIEQEFIPYFLLVFFGIVLLILIAYGIKDEVIKFKYHSDFHENFKLKEVFTFSIYNALNYLGGILAFRIDLIMIASLLSLEQNGVYAKMLFMVSIMNLPSKILKTTTGPFISKLLNEDNVKEIEKIYKSSSLMMFTFGLLLYCAIYLSLDAIFSISSNPSSFADGEAIFSILGIAVLIELLFGLNGVILGFSKYFRYNLYFILILAVVNVTFNYLFISNVGIIGAAYASVIGYITFNLFKGIMIYYKFKIHPFSSEMLGVFTIGMILFLFFYWIDIRINPFVHIVLVPGVLSILFIGSIYYLKISKTINSNIDTFLKKMNFKTT